jgi:glycosyltransferase involved in cell wall biosynthesis
VVADSAITIDPHDIDAFVNAMYDVLMDEKLREALICKGLKRAQLFNWEKSAEEMRRIYEQLNSNPL